MCLPSCIPPLPIPNPLIAPRLTIPPSGRLILLPHKVPRHEPPHAQFFNPHAGRVQGAVAWTPSPGPRTCCASCQPTAARTTPPCCPAAYPCRKPPPPRSAASKRPRLYHTRLQGCRFNTYKIMMTLCKDAKAYGNKDLHNAYNGEFASKVLYRSQMRDASIDNNIRKNRNK